MRDCILCVLVWELCVLACGVASEVLYQREPTEEERKRFVVRETEDIWGANTFTEEELKTEYAKRKWGPEVVKVELKHVSRKDDRPPGVKNRSLKDWPEGWPYIAILFLGEVLYENRDVPAAPGPGRQSYWADYPRGADIEEIRRKWGAREYRPNVASVSLLYRGCYRDPPYLRPYVETVEYIHAIVLDREYAARWKELAVKYALGADFRDYKCRPAERSWPVTVVEGYSNADGDSTGARHWTYKDASEARHEMIAQCILKHQSEARTPWGVVVKAQPEIEHKGGAKPYVRNCIYWQAEGGHVIEIIGGGQSGRNAAMELAEHIGPKFPSSLPQDWRLDKTAWGVAETEARLEEIASCFKGKCPDRDGLSLSLGRLLRYVDAPGKDISLRANLLSMAEGRAFSAKLLEWWSKGKPAATWDEKANRLVVRIEGDKAPVQGARPVPWP